MSYRSRSLPTSGRMCRKGTPPSSMSAWYSGVCMSLSATYLAAMMAVMMGSRKRTSLVISIVMTAMDTVRRVTPPMKAPQPMSAKMPGSIHSHLKLPAASTPAMSTTTACAAADTLKASKTSTTASPATRPTQLPITSIGTKMPEATCVVAAAQLKAEYTARKLSSTPYENCRGVSRDSSWLTVLCPLHSISEPNSLYSMPAPPAGDRQVAVSTVSVTACRAMCTAAPAAPGPAGPSPVDPGS